MRKRKSEEKALLPVLREALMRRSAKEWAALFGDKVPCAVVQKLEDMFENPQVLAQQIIKTLPHAVLGSYRGVCEPIRFSHPGDRIQDTGAPRLGQDTRQILETLKRSPEEIKSLFQNSVCQ